MSFLPPSRSRDCRRARTWISRALDDDLGETERVRLGEHIGACPECRRHQEVLEQGRQWMLAAEAEPSENFEWKVQLGIQKALRERAAEATDTAIVGERWSFWRPAVASALAVTVLVVGMGAWLLPGDGTGTIGDGRDVEAPVGATSLVGARTVGEEEPDLSGAVRTNPFEIDVTDGDFGIRTVGGPGFRDDLYAPVREGRRGLWPTLPSSMQTTIMQHLFWNSRAGPAQKSGVQRLNMPMRRSTLPTSGDVRDSIATGSAGERR